VDEARPFGLERLVFFPDAVFAIAITLLALDLRLPQLAEDVAQGTFNAALVGLEPKLFSYGLNFAIVGLLWLGHWRRFEHVRAPSETLVAINLVLLALVALIPFPTALLGEHGDQPGAVVLYALIVSAAGIVGSVSWLYAERAGLTTPGRSRRWVRLSTLRGLVAPLVLLGSLPLVLVHPYAAEAAWVLIFPLQALMARAVQRVGVAAAPAAAT
jgi:uncharacterized membrane protein